VATLALIAALTATTTAAPARSAAPPSATAARSIASGGELIAAAEWLRRDRCASAGNVRPALRRREVLDRATREFAGGAPLGEALQRVGYVATESAGLRIDGATDAASLRALAESRFCAPLSNPALSETGAWRSGRTTWLIVATPPQPTGPAGTRASVVSGSAAPQPAAGRREVLALVNAARASPRRCGAQSFAASPPLAASATLEQVAEAHVLDMAQRSYFDHTGADGSSPTARVTRGGYDWRIAGENLALGRMTAREAVVGWLASPGHCANIMDPRFTETGVALAPGRERDGPTYWAQTFAAPRSR